MRVEAVARIRHRPVARLAVADRSRSGVPDPPHTRGATGSRGCASRRWASSATGPWRDWQSPDPAGVPGPPRVQRRRRAISAPYAPCAWCAGGWPSRRRSEVGIGRDPCHPVMPGTLARDLRRIRPHALPTSHGMNACQGPSPDPRQTPSLPARARPLATPISPRAVIYDRQVSAPRYGPYCPPVDCRPRRTVPAEPPYRRTRPRQARPPGPATIPPRKTRRRTQGRDRSIRPTGKEIGP